MQKITPFLWFDDQLEEAIGFYTSIFRNARVTDINQDLNQEREVDAGRRPGTGALSCAPVGTG